MGTHMNCKLMQFTGVPTTYVFYKEVDKKYTGCNLKTTELLDRGLTGVCVVIRSNTVVWNVNCYSLEWHIKG